jgi:diguanylate cyclase (GGDEF)-like protein/PAS domain S-box-containing protein
VSGAVARLLGYRTEDLMRDLSWDYVHPADAPALAKVLDRLIAEPRRHERTVLRVRDGEDQWRWVEATLTNCLADADIAGIVANLRDVTDNVRRDEELRRSEALHRAMVETAQEGILATAPDGTVIFANETAAEMVGRTIEELRGQDPWPILGVAGSAAVDDVVVHEVVHVGPRGEERILEVSRRPLNSRDSGLGALISLHDVTDARQAERALRRRALHDPLTSLPNRYLFLDRLETAAARQRRSPGRGTAVLFVDIDAFKEVNDACGHEAGDGVLREVANRLLGSVRATDTVGRLGGDEFAVICEDAGADEALLVARRVLDAFGAPIPVGGEERRVALSIGIALAPPYDVDELVRRADEAMYRAKQSGGGRALVAGDEIHDPEPGR